ncbi:MAG: helix-turn-helix transcriptional regulator [Myxococcota bacterium]
MAPRRRAGAGRRPKRYSQAARVLRLLDLLQAHHYGRTHADLADALGVSERQVRRDLAVLDEVGYGWERVTLDGQVGARLMERGRKAIHLSLRERYTLLAVRGVFDVLEGTPFHEDVQSIFDQVVASLPTDQQQDIERLGDRFTYLPDGGVKHYGGKEEVLDGLLTGVLRRLRVSARYNPHRGRRRTGLFEPYAMVLYRHGLYAVGAFVDPDTDAPGEPATYAAERFQEAEHRRGEHFDVPEGFHIDAYFDGAFGIFAGQEPQKVVVDFAPEVARLVRARQWHPTQRLRALKGGGVRLEMHPKNLIPVTQWLVGWGAWTAVREPEWLGEQVRDEHRRAAELPGAPG